MPAAKVRARDPVKAKGIENEANATELRLPAPACGREAPAFAIAQTGVLIQTMVLTLFASSSRSRRRKE
jgi:predicted dienelactone hydrolase